MKDTKGLSLLPSPTRSATPRALLLTLASALATAPLPTAVAANDLGAPGRPMLVAPDRVVVEGLVRARELESGATELALLSPSGRLYRLAGIERAGLREEHVGRHVTVTGSVREVENGPDELLVERVRLGGR